MLTATGIGSGIDIDGLVTQLVEAERAPEENRILVSEVVLNSELSALGVFQSGLSGLSSALSSLRDESLFQSFTSSSSDNSVVIASASSEASAGSYEIEVLALAESQSLASSAFASKTDSIGTGTLSISFGTTDYVGPDPGPESYNSFALNPDKGALSIELDANNSSLESIRDTINERDAGVSASLVSDGSGYRLLLTSDDTGAENSMQISVTDLGDSDDFDTSGLSVLAFNASATNMQQTKAAADSSVTLNGLAITSATNQLEDVLDGVSLTLTGLSDSEPTNIEISQNTAAVTQAVSGFVSGYNSFINAVSQVSGYNSEEEQGAILQGDSTVRTISNQLRSFISNPVDSASGDFQFLAEIGIRTDATGNLTLDSAELTEALEQDTASVTALFADVTQTTDADIDFIGVNTETLTGTYAIDISQLGSQASYLGASIGFPLIIDNNNDDFSLSVNGTSSNNIKITQGSYTSGDDLAAELQSRINGDENLAEESALVEVSFNSADNRIEILSRQFGSETSIEILGVDTNSFADLGLQIAAGTDGLDVEGSINGIQATGEGTLLTGAEETDVAGLILDISGNTLGSRGSAIYTNGLAGQIEDLIEGYLSDGGLLELRTESIDEQLADLEIQQQDLDLRIESLEARLFKQFNALDSLLAQLQTTSEFLTLQLDSLPGPRTNNN